MLDKIRKAMTSIDEVQTIKKELLNVKKELSNSKNAFDDALVEIKESVKKQTKEHLDILKKKEDSIVRINNVASEFEKSLNEFKTMKSNLQNKVIQDVSQEIKKELNVYIMNVKEKIDDLNDAGKEILKASENTSEMLSVFNKIKDIGSKIKKEDFELTKHAAELMKNDKEKLELMKKIDNLERLIAKQRKSPSKGMQKF